MNPSGTISEEARLYREREDEARGYRERLLKRAEKCSNGMGRSIALGVMTIVLYLILKDALKEKWWTVGVVSSVARMTFWTSLAGTFFYFLWTMTLHGVVVGLVSDMPVVAPAMFRQPLVPLGTMRWLVARQRMWKRLVKTGIWLVAEISLMVLLSFAGRWVIGLGFLGLVPMLMLPFTGLAMHSRAAGFVIGSRLVLKMSQPVDPALPLAPVQVPEDRSPAS